MLFEEAYSYLSLAFLQIPKCCKMQRDNFAPYQLIFLGLTGLENYSARVVGAKGMGGG